MHFKAYRELLTQYSAKKCGAHSTLGMLAKPFLCKSPRGLLDLLYVSKRSLCCECVMCCLGFVVLAHCYSFGVMIKNDP